jgi:hypothetical protein
MLARELGISVNALLNRAMRIREEQLLGPGNYTVRLDSNGTLAAYYSFTVCQ